jgi:hypothetical protein
MFCIASSLENGAGVSVWSRFMYIPGLKKTVSLWSRVRQPLIEDWASQRQDPFLQCIPWCVQSTPGLHCTTCGSWALGSPCSNVSLAATIVASNKPVCMNLWQSNLLAC